jgi:hypothetical protein
MLFRKYLFIIACATLFAGGGFYFASRYGENAPDTRKDFNLVAQIPIGERAGESIGDLPAPGTREQPKKDRFIAPPSAVKSSANEPQKNGSAALVPSPRVTPKQTPSPPSPSAAASTAGQAPPSPATKPPPLPAGGPTPVPPPAPSPFPSPPPSPLSPPTPMPAPSGGASSASNANHVLISEIQAGTDEGGPEDEFVELYNPTEQIIVFAGWVLKKRASTGNEVNLVSSAAFSGSIAPRSFFLIAHKNYSGVTPADLIYSANSNNLAYTNNAVILYDAAGLRVDEADWVKIEKGESLERRAWQNGCLSAQGSGEYLGNGCDSDSSASDFEKRQIAHPQNSSSSPEP